MNALKGDIVLYLPSEGARLIRGRVAEIAVSPLTGRDRLRVVDLCDSDSDEGAGRWIDPAAVRWVETADLDAIGAAVAQPTPKEGE